MPNRAVGQSIRKASVRWLVGCLPVIWLGTISIDLVMQHLLVRNVWCMGGGWLRAPELSVVVVRLDVVRGGGGSWGGEW